VLLASHDTAGAQAAERAALDALAAGGSLHHLVIVPEFWQSITGDGWRISDTEHQFCDYSKARSSGNPPSIGRVNPQARARGIRYSASSRHGRLEDCLNAATRQGEYDLVVIGAPRPKGQPGFRSRINLDKLARGLRVPLVVIPHPGHDDVATE
jgi:nucleotide-binding universal stress UspA family protein